MKLTDIARICHDANRTYCATLGDHSQVPWDEAEDWQRNSAVEGVKFHIDNPEAPASAGHESWLKHKITEGWQYGADKDPDNRRHPCMVAFKDLPPAQQAKDHLFSAICKALAPFAVGK